MVFETSNIKFIKPDVAIAIVTWTREASKETGPGHLPAGTGVVTMVRSKTGDQSHFKTLGNPSHSLGPGTSDTVWIILAYFEHEIVRATIFLKSYQSKLSSETNITQGRDSPE